MTAYVPKIGDTVKCVAARCDGLRYGTFGIIVKVGDNSEAVGARTDVSIDVDVAGTIHRHWHTRQTWVLEMPAKRFVMLGKWSGDCANGVFFAPGMAKHCGEIHEVARQFDISVSLKGVHAGAWSNLHIVDVPAPVAAQTPEQIEIASIRKSIEEQTARLRAMEEA